MADENRPDDVQEPHLKALPEDQENSEELSEQELDNVNGGALPLKVPPGPPGLHDS